MPPRRSSRATSASYDPPPPAAEEVEVKKRKRGPSTQPEADEEPVTKPASRARRSTSARPSAAPPTKARKASGSRAKPALPDLAESDDEETADAPPPKKARPSIENGDDIKVEEDEEEVVKEKPKRLRRGSAQPSAAMDVDEAPKRRTTSRKTNVSAGSRTSVGSGEASGSARIDEEDEEEEEIVKPTKGRRPAGKKAAARAPVSDDEAENGGAPSEDDYEEEEEKPARKGRKGKAPATKGKAKAPAKGKAAAKAVKVVDVSDEDEDLPLPPPTQSRSKKAAPTPPPAPEPEPEEEEEEKSLFEPPPMPAASTLPTVMPDEPSGPKSRLVIHKMALVNFKSYAGRQEIGPFHKSFSSIVGPNGSGKSNTIDALLFVFGYRASKMRQGKISELIHNSANHPDLQECSVEVHFRDIIDLPGPDAFKVVPDSQLVVTRTAYKNNQSKYTINGRTNTYGDVQKLLKGRGIDLDHNRFLILQGEVESIAQMKPKAPSEHEDGLLEYLEDIIGTSLYKKPIDEAMVKMEELQEDRQMKMNRLRHVEKEKAALEEKKKEAEEFLRMKNELVRANSKLYQWYVWKIQEKIDLLEVTLEKLNKELANEVERHKGDIEHLDSLKKHFEEREMAYEEVQALAKQAVKDLANFERQEVGLQEKKKHASGRAKKLKKSVNDDTAALRQAQQTIKDSKDKMKKEKAKLEEHEASLEREEKVLEAIQDSLKDKTQVFHDKIQVKQRELQPWTAQINARTSEIDVATSEREALVKKADALREQTREAQETLMNLQSDLKGKLEAHGELKAEKGTLGKAIADADKRFKDAQARFQEWKGKAAVTRGKVEEVKSNQAENRSKNNVLESLTRLKDGGKNEGFHGRLGNLGTIPDKYDVAVSTACGFQLNNMLVDRVEQAQSCIEYLRKNNVGRASFFVLEKLGRPPGMDEPVQTPEGVPRLFDLIKPLDPKYRPAFFKAVGQTLVANDMDQANRIAFGARRWRVVTLDGGVIEVSGAMSGGGGPTQRGAMSSKFAAATVSPQVMQTYERDSEHAAQQLAKATAELRDVEAELEGLKRRDPEIDMSAQKIVMEIETVKRRIAEAEKRFKDLSSQNKPNSGDLARISKLETDISASQKALDKIKEKSDAIVQEIKNFEQKILDIGGSKLLTQKSKVEGIRLHIDLANDEITKAEVAKTKAEKDTTKLENNLKSNGEQLEKLETELQELQEGLDKVVEEVGALKENVEEARQAAENQKEDLQNLKKELDEQEAEIAEFRKREMKIKQAIADGDKDLNDNVKALDHYSELHDELALEEIEEDDDEEEDSADKEKEKEKAGEKEKDKEEMMTEDGDNATEADSEVKAEEEEDGAAPPPKKQKEKPPANELHIFTSQELKAFKKDHLMAEIALLEEKIQRAKPDLSVLKEWKQREQEFMNRAADLDNVTAQRDAQKAKYDELRKRRLDEFMAGFSLISLKLKEMYQMITLGGNAELELVDSMDPFSEGIIFSVMPPKKSWKNISNLSGGEKTLSSLALVFALHVFKPTPLYFMDEIDAALDFRNVSIVANYIKDRTKNAQFIIISLRNDMFELSHRLIGIYKTSNATRSIAIDNHSLHATVPRPQHPPVVATTAAS